MNAIDYSAIDALKERLDSYRPLRREIVENLHENLILQWTYNSNAIEGNTLTIKETKVALEGITIGGKTMREHFEVINHREAITFIEELVKKNEPLSEWDIKSIHQLILKNIDNGNAGKYRDVNVRISGADHVPPDALHISEAMASFIEWYKVKAIDMHPLERAARVHGEFVKIHPFTDGNGRTARLLTNLELMKSGYPAVVIPVERRLDYYVALDTAHTTNDYTLFLKLMLEMCKDSFSPYWYAIGINNDEG